MGKKYQYIEGPELLHCRNGGFRIPDDFKRCEMKTNEKGQLYAPFKRTPVFNIKRVRTKVAILVKPFWSERKAQKMAREEMEKMK